MLEGRESGRKAEERLKKEKNDRRKKDEDWRGESMKSVDAIRAIVFLRLWGRNIFCLFCYSVQFLGNVFRMYVKVSLF